MPGRAVRQRRVGGGREFDGPRTDSNKVVALWHWAENSRANQPSDPTGRSASFHVARSVAVTHIRSVPLQRWIAPQLSKLVQKAPSGPNWVHEIKFDGFRMAARIERSKVQLLTRSGLDWT